MRQKKPSQRVHSKETRQDKTSDKVAAMTREINGMNDARKAGAIGEMWHCMTRLAKRHKPLTLTLTDY